MDDNVFAIKDSPNMVFQITDPPSSITLHSPDGRKAFIDFGGDEVIYSGDLPVAESAKIFFACVCYHFRK